VLQSSIPSTSTILSTPNNFSHIDHSMPVLSSLSSSALPVTSGVIPIAPATSLNQYEVSVKQHFDIFKQLLFPTPLHLSHIQHVGSGSMLLYFYFSV
jgi:hypothetical protein